MIKQFTLVTRKPGLTREEFNRHWKEIHGPIFAKAPGLKRYVQNHYVEIPGRDYLADGIVETWFDDMDAQQNLKAWIDSGEAKELMDDAAKFLDGSKETVWFTEEHEMISGGSYPIKEIGIVYRKPSMTREEFYRYWENVHGPLAMRTIPGLRKYIQNHLISLPGVQYDGDGIVETWYDSLKDFQNLDDFYQSADGKALLEDADKFLDGNNKNTWLVQEHVIK